MWGTRAERHHPGRCHPESHAERVILPRRGSSTCTRPSEGSTAYEEDIEIGKDVLKADPANTIDVRTRIVVEVGG